MANYRDTTGRGALASATLRRWLIPLGLPMIALLTSLQAMSARATQQPTDLRRLSDRELKSLIIGSEFRFITEIGVVVAPEITQQFNRDGSYLRRGGRIGIEGTYTIKDRGVCVVIRSPIASRDCFVVYSRRVSGQVFIRSAGGGTLVEVSIIKN